LSLHGYSVSQICVNSAYLEILLGDDQSSIAVGISAPFSMRQNGREQTINLKESKTLAPILVLLNKEAKYLEVFRDGSLKLVMDDGKALSVSKDGTSEAWFANGTERLAELPAETPTPKQKPTVRA
jgi:hypothetical protein